MKVDKFSKSPHEHDTDQEQVEYPTSKCTTNIVLAVSQ